MINRKMRDKLLLLAIVLIANTMGLFAQQAFKYRSELPVTTDSGFYTIALTPAITAKCQAGLADIRLADKNGKFIPYLFGSLLPAKEHINFLEFPKVNVSRAADSVTVYIAENKLNYSVSRLWLKLRNTAVDRIINLYGSDDLKEWYAIKENLHLAEADSATDNKGSFEQLLNFPASTYRYFKIAVNHKNTAAVAILQVGIYERDEPVTAYTVLPAPVFKQKDSAKLSTIVIKFNDAYQINKLHLDIASPKFYKRSVLIYQLDRGAFRLLGDTVIHSTNPSDLVFPAKTQAIKLEIVNEDNPALVVTAVTAYQLNQALIAYLEKGRQYHFLFGDPAATVPVYDLSYFTDSLQRPLPKISAGAVASNPLYQPKVKTMQGLPAWLLWVAIGAVVIVLLWLTMKMTGEVKKREIEG